MININKQCLESAAKKGLIQPGKVDALWNDLESQGHSACSRFDLTNVI